jgi:hypothetical protein
MPQKPPSDWWDKRYAEVKQGNPDYSDEQIRKTVGDIWYNKMSPSKKQQEVKKSEGSAKKAGDNIITIAVPESVKSAVLGSEELSNSALGTLLQTLPPNGQIQIAKEEAEGIKEVLLTVLQSAQDEALGEAVTDMLMDIDEKVFSGEQQADSAIGEALDETMSGLDDFFKESKTAAGFPNLFSNDTKKWIQLQTSNLAAKKGTPATPEQAQAYIDAAATQVAQELSVSIEPEVKKVVEESRDKIFQDITSGVEFQQPQVKPAPVEAPMTARQKAMSESLKRAFDNSYAYDAVAFVLEAEFGGDYQNKYAADELIDEEEAILDLVNDAFRNLARTELSDAFGNVLTDMYSIER